MRSCPRHSRTLAKCLAPSRGHSKTTPQRSAGRAVRSTELVPFSTSDEWYSRHRPVWFRLRRVRERWAVTPDQPLAHARGSSNQFAQRAATVRERWAVTPDQPLAHARGSSNQFAQRAATVRERLAVAPEQPLAGGTVKKRGDTAAAR